MWRCGEKRCCAYFGPKSGDGKLALQHGREKFEKEFTLEVFEKRMTWILEHIVYPLFSKMGIERD